MKSQTYLSGHRYLNILFIVAAAGIAALALTACSDSTDANDDDGPGQHEVWMDNQAFYPGNRTVTAGTTVTWINQSSEVHTATSGSGGEHDGLFNSGDVSPGEQFSYRFDETGTYNYFCIPHQPHMTGTITVVPEGQDTDGNDGNGY